MLRLNEVGSRSVVIDTEGRQVAVIEITTCESCRSPTWISRTSWTKARA